MNIIFSNKREAWERLKTSNSLLDQCQSFRVIMMKIREIEHLDYFMFYPLICVHIGFVKITNGYRLFKLLVLVKKLLKIQAILRTTIFWTCSIYLTEVNVTKLDSNFAIVLFNFILSTNKDGCYSKY